MKNLLIKVCGMRERANIEAIAELAPDYMGFIYFDKSKRYVGKDFDLSWFDSFAEKKRLKISKVGVFVDSDLKLISDAIKKDSLDVVQMHGSESAELCRELKNIFPKIEIWKVFGVDSSFDFLTTQIFKNVCDKFIFDTQSNDYGGSGVAFDWSLLSAYDKSLPVVLAGGVGKEQVPALDSLLNSGFPLHAIDVNSKVEISPGLKSVELLKEIIEKVRA